MGKKYIIELEEPEMFDERKYYQCSQMPWWSVSENIVENLTPYTEPDMEQNRKEAYAEGYKEGMQLSIDDAKLKEAYKKGLSDAWEAARKINCLPSSGGIENYVLGKIFGHNSNPIIMEKFSASECIEKIRAYEQEKEEQIQVGDEVEDGVANIIVLEINEDGTVYGFDDEGSIIHATPRKKTGRHFSEIAEALQKMRGRK